MTKDEIREISNSAKNRIRLNYALNMADRSDFKRHRVGALIYNSAGDAIATGWSHYSILNLKNYEISIHAELHAILRTPQRKDLFGASIYVARKNVKSGTTGIAKPCERCMAVLIEAGFKEVYFTGHGEKFGKLDLTNPEKPAMMVVS